MTAKLTQPIMKFATDRGVMGAVKRAADTRTVEELTESIRLWGEMNPEVQMFLPHLKDINPKHLGLVADTIELSYRQASPYKSINFLQPTPSEGKSVLGILLDIYRKASKTNPEGMEFAQEVVNNTDIAASKFFLWNLTGGIFEQPVQKQFAAAKPLVQTFAQDTLWPPAHRGFAQEHDFMGLIQTVVDPSADPKKVSMLSDIISKIRGKAYMSIQDFVTSKAPIEKVTDNMNSLEEVATMTRAKGITLNADEFLTKNTNLY